MSTAFSQNHHPDFHYSERFGLEASSVSNNKNNSNLLYEDGVQVLCYDGRIDIPEEEWSVLLNENKYIYKAIYKYILKYIYYSPSKLRGDFAIVAYNKLKEELVLIRDQLGCRPLYYCVMDDFLAFSTEMKALKSIPDFHFEIDETWVLDAMAATPSEKWRTPYKGIKRLLPGHYLHFGSSVEIKSYWNLEVNPDLVPPNYNIAIEYFREKLTQSVKKRVYQNHYVASELSGGIDSSGVTAMAAMELKKRGGHCYGLTHAFSDASLGKFFPYKDERAFSMEVANFTGLEEQVFCDADGFGLLERLKNEIFIQSGPVQQGYSMFSDTLYHRGKDRGVATILSGFGGDEGVTSKASGFFQEMVVKKKWEKFKQEYFARGKVDGINQVKTYLGYFMRRYLPISKDFVMLFKSQKDWRLDKYHELAIDQELAHRLGLKERFFNRAGFPDDPDVRQRQYKRIMHDHVSERFEYSYFDAKHYGIEYAYPLWDIDLLEFYYSLPAEYKFRNGMGRAIFRDAMKGLLPEKVRLRNDKTGATVPTVQQRFLKDYDKITELIQRSRKENRFHYLDYDKLLQMQVNLKNRKPGQKKRTAPGAFFNSLQILILQEMERTGEFKSGIRC